MLISQGANTLILTIRTLYLIRGLKIMGTFSLLILSEAAIGCRYEIFSLILLSMVYLLQYIGIESVASYRERVAQAFRS